ncbi:hypothetical protein SHJG_5476 [Streptomyces hygroscopicus subsp. jinggangensis 5008]|nr:hypothetical protein SHJG_5476 [Streptomyces hygroscopicus subsp. jinggangensis 5008]AGF64902.1 hypothetical protein SHJGH_5239 [Streptomyces hygroscopicus subsp. jinggangensis TL01]
MNATVTKLPPRPARPGLRIVGVVVVDLSGHVDRGTLMSFRPTVDIPPRGYAPGTNLEIHIGGARRVYEGDANLRAVVAAAHDCTIVVKGQYAEGVIEAQRALTRLAGMTPRPGRLGCERGACELLYGPSDHEGPRR